MGEGGDSVSVLTYHKKRKFEKRKSWEPNDQIVYAGPVCRMNCIVWDALELQQTKFASMVKGKASLTQVSVNATRRRTCSMLNMYTVSKIEISVIEVVIRQNH